MTRAFSAVKETTTEDLIQVYKYLKQLSNVDHSDLFLASHKLEN